jgi:hypothetical protein
MSAGRCKKQCSAVLRDRADRCFGWFWIMPLVSKPCLEMLIPETRREDIRRGELFACQGNFWVWGAGGSFSRRSSYIAVPHCISTLHLLSRFHGPAANRRLVIP